MQIVTIRGKINNGLKNSGGIILKKGIIKLIVSAAAFAAAVIGAAMLPGASAEAATLKDINDPSVFLKQQESDTCTLCANVMMLRRTALTRGDSDWSSITEYGAKPSIWCWGAGMYNSYSYKGISVSYGRIQYNAEAELIALLREHPEGIVAYDYDYPHAILLTDYTDGVFYCCDPANCVEAGRVTADRAIVPVGGIEAYWYVESPDVQLTEPVPEKLRNTSSLNKTAVYAGESVTVKAGATGGEGAYRFSYYARRNGDAAWKTLALRTKASSVSFSPSEAGTYDVYIIAEDEKGSSANRHLELRVKKPLTNESSVSSKTVDTGSVMALQGKASGGEGKYEYAYYYRKTTVQGFTMLGGYSGETTAAFRPRTEGSYEILIKVRDSKGTIVKRSFFVTAVKNEIKNTSSISAQNIRAGQTVFLKGSASGGSGKYQFAYYYRKKSMSDWATIKSYSSSAAVPFTPLSAEEYELMIKAKDTEARIEKRIFTLKVIKPLKNSSTTSSKDLKRGTSAIIRGNADGGSGGYEYAFFCRRAGSSQWTLLRDYKPSSNIVYTSSQAGAFKILVLVRDSEGTVAEKYISINYLP